VLESSPADEATGKGEEAFVDLVTAIGAQEEPAPVCAAKRRCVRRLSGGGRPGAVFGLASGDQRV
jgi:hypothetical protein